MITETKKTDLLNMTQDVQGRIAVLIDKNPSGMEEGTLAALRLLSEVVDALVRAQHAVIE